MTHTLRVTNPTASPFVGWVPFTLPTDAIDGPYIVRRPDGPPAPVLLGEIRNAVCMAYAHLTLPAASSLALPFEQTDTDAPIEVPQFDDIDGSLIVNGTSVSLKWNSNQDGPRRRSGATARVGAFVFHLMVHQYAGVKAAVWELLVVASDPTVPDTFFHLGDLAIAMNGAWLAVSHDQWRQDSAYLGSTLVLARNLGLADSQGVAFTGAFVLPDFEAASWATSRPWAVCSLWSGQFGPLDSLTTLGAQAASQARGEALAFAGRRGNGNLLAAPRLGLSPNANSSGAQHEFGVVKGLGAFAEPGYLAELYHSALQEACRGGNYREANGDVVEPGNHPNHVTWNHQTHWHPSVSSDRLGKPAGLPTLAGGWGGPDREHWSCNVLGAAFLLTGSPILEMLLAREARLILSGETIDPRLSTSHAGAVRGIGRTLHTAAWCATALGGQGTRPALIERIKQRLERVIEPETRGAQSAAYGQATGTVSDVRYLGSTVPAVSWQEPIAYVGLLAWFKAMTTMGLDGGRQAALAMFLRAAPSWLLHFWYRDAGRWWMYDFVALADPDHHQRNEGFEEWCGGALQLCVEYLPESEPMREKAIEILRQYEPRSLSEHEWMSVPPEAVR